MRRHDRRRQASIKRKLVKRFNKLVASGVVKPVPIAAAAKPAAIAGGLTCLRPVQIAAADASQPAAPRTFTLIAYTGEAMNIYPFDCPVVVDLDTYVAGVQRIPALYDHRADLDNLVGQIESIAVQPGESGPQLVATGRFTVTSSDWDMARHVLAKADAGHQWQVSIGANASSITKIEPGIEFTANGGRKYVGPAYLARGPEFRELSFVVIGGDQKTSAVVARRRRASTPPTTPTPIKGTAMSFEEWLMSLGFSDPASLDEVQKANLKLMYQEDFPEGSTDTTAADEPPAPNPDEPPPANAHGRRPNIRGSGTPTPPTRTDIIRARLAAEAQAEAQVSAIRAACVGAEHLQIDVTAADGTKQKVGLLVHALASGWDANRTELERLRAERGSGPGLISRDHDRDCTVEALQGAMILRAGGRLDHPSYQSQQAIAMRLPTWLRAGINADQKQRAMEMAHRFSTLSAVDLCREACRLSGRSAPHYRDDMIQAAFSGGSLTNIFTTNVNAVLLASYMDDIDTTVGWVLETDVNDFKTNERPRVEMGPGLKKLPRGSEAQHSKMSDTAESYKISRFAAQFQVDEQDMIDDNLGVFADQPTRHGQAAKRLKPDLVYGIILRNPTLTQTGRSLFHATDGNLLTSAALTAAKLRAALATMRLFRENSVNLNIEGTHVIVPPSLEELAWELANSTQILIAGAADTERGNVNSIQRRNLTIVSDARLENGLTDPSDESSQTGSATTWFIASAMAWVIEVGYLTGTGRAPRVRTTLLDKGKYGINWDVNMDIGAMPLDWKGMIKNTA